MKAAKSGQNEAGLTNPLSERILLALEGDIPRAAIFFFAWKPALPDDPASQARSLHQG